jgi:hypothetical protein
MTKTPLALQKFRDLDKYALTDLLAQYTSRLIRIRKEGGSEEEYAACKETIQLLLNEIELRKNLGAPGTAGTDMSLKD